jgi:3-oxoacyl-[acyl-carrier-protein] synthase-1
MRPVYAIASHAISALGIDVASHWQAVASGRIGVQQINDPAFSESPVWASRMSDEQWTAIGATEGLSPFEQICFYSAANALNEVGNAVRLTDTVFILSTTKGNIEWLDSAPPGRLGLMDSARHVSSALGLNTKPIVISQACISGVTALLHGLRLLQAGRYKHAIVTGADRFTRFVLSGFQSFQAIANGPCRPFDASRTGINLGEAAATIILLADTSAQPLGRLYSGATSNDANHISGPSRTGEELALAIQSALQDANISAADIDAISAHGTATIYNDEMESKAFGVAGVSHVPVHSFKGYTGHTLGAAGILESVMMLESMRKGILIPSAGFENLGVSQPLNITTTPVNSGIRYALKTASGFGGCNAAIVWGREA